MTFFTASEWKQSITEQVHIFNRAERAKTYSYDACNIDVDFSLDAILGTRFFCMTAQMSGVLPDDCIEINHQNGIEIYQVKEIEYYEEPSDMWIAKLL